jgi:DNA-binding MarR family transcriptional regulator
MLKSLTDYLTLYILHVMSLRREIVKITLDLSKHLELRGVYKKGDLSPLQLWTLVYIKEKGCVKSSELAREFNVTPATITAQIDKLVNNGWLERCDDGEDRRVINISLTEKSHREVDDLVQRSLDKYNWIFELLTKKEKEDMLRIFTKLHDHAHSMENKK